MSSNLAHLSNKVKPFAKQSREGFSLIPNIIYEIGLDHYSRDVYGYIKRVAGESGQCWKSIPTIAKQLGISENTVRRSIKTLLERRPELGGKSLIVKVASRHPSNTYEVVNIWIENSRLMGLHHRHLTPSAEAPSPFTTGWSTPSPQADKEDPLKKIPEEDFFKKREKTFSNHERPSGLSRDPQFEDSAQADLSQADSYDEYTVPDSHDEKIVVPDDVKSFMPPPPEIFDWLVSDLKRF